MTTNFLKPVPDQWITEKVKENPQRILNYAQDKRCSNEIWVESTWLNYFPPSIHVRDHTAVNSYTVPMYYC